MAKHTPGPYSFAAMGNETEIIDANDRVVAVIPLHSGQNIEEHQGTAHLLSAAPEMASAIRALIDAYGGDWPDWLQDELAAAETAVLKAEGKTNG
jgi:hypothetical protein